MKKSWLNIKWEAGKAMNFESMDENEEKRLNKNQYLSFEIRFVLAPSFPPSLHR